jgi:hypothetical protein
MGFVVDAVVVAVARRVQVHLTALLCETGHEPIAEYPVSTSQVGAERPRGEMFLSGSNVHEETQN